MCGLKSVDFPSVFPCIQGSHMGKGERERKKESESVSMSRSNGELETMEKLDKREKAKMLERGNTVVS